MMRKAASSSRAFKSLRLVFTMSMTCLRVTLPTLVLFGSFEPAAMLAAFFNRTAAGGLLVMNVNDLSLKTVITTGRMSPACFCVAALNSLQNAMMFTPRGPRAVPTGGAGLACPAGICSLIWATISLAILERVCSRDLGADGSAAFDLPIFQFHRRGATKNSDRNAQLATLRIDLFNDTGLILERTVGDLHGFANFEADFWFHLLFALLHLREHAFHFRLSHGNGFVLGSGKPDHARCIADEIPGAPDQLIVLVEQMHINDQITGEKFPRGFSLFAFFDFRDAFGRKEHVVNHVAHLFGFNAFHNILAHFVFLTGKHMHDVPLIFRCECLSHKSVQSGEEVHNVHQDKIKQCHVATEQQHRDRNHDGRVHQFLVAAESLLLWVPWPRTFLQLDLHLAEEALYFGHHCFATRFVRPHARRDSNPQPTVLETATLPIELLAYI